MVGTAAPEKDDAASSSAHSFIFRQNYKWRPDRRIEHLSLSLAWLYLTFNFAEHVQSSRAMIFILCTPEEIWYAVVVVIDCCWR
jgi:hypothetical protein